MTPNRYRTAGFGFDVDAMTDDELRGVLVRASALVDAYCAVPNVPSKYSFSGGSVTGEQHTWQLGTEITNGTRRIYPVFRPLKTVTSFVVKFTNTYQVTIDPTNLYINQREGWAEVVSLAAVVSGMYPVGINFGLYVPVAEIDYTYGYEFSMADEELYVTDGLTYQAARGFWLTSPAPVIKKNGTPQSSGFTINYTEGEVTFATAPAATDVITASYSYSLPDPIVQATGLTASSLLGERDLAAKGMTGLSSLRVAEVALSRSRVGGSIPEKSNVIPESAASLLDAYLYRSVA